MNRINIREKEWQERIADSKNWMTYQRKHYKVKIQKALLNKEYNIPGKKGVVYNYLEDSEESLDNADYVVTGLLGEIWPISEKYLAGYEANKEDIDEEPKEFFTKITGQQYQAIQIPIPISFSLDVMEYGILNGNANGDRIPHGEGDYIVCNSFEEGDFRVVNGAIFQKMYERVK